MTPRGPRKGFKLKKPRAPITKHPATADVPEEVVGNAHRGAFKKGMEARRAGKHFLRSNPYDASLPRWGGRALWRKFRQGFDYADRLEGGSGTLHETERWEAESRHARQ